MDRGELTALYVIGENPLQSEADRHAERRLRSLDVLIVQDLFLTATAEIADVVFPASAAWAEARDRHQLASGGSSACARRWSRPARRATTCGSSSSSRSAWVTIGARPTPNRCGTRSAPFSPVHRGHEL